MARDCTAQQAARAVNDISQCAVAITPFKKIAGHAGIRMREGKCPIRQVKFPPHKLHTLASLAQLFLQRQIALKRMVNAVTTHGKTIANHAANLLGGKIRFLLRQKRRKIQADQFSSGVQQGALGITNRAQALDGFLHF